MIALKLDAFRPLEYLEVQQGKPLYEKLGRYMIKIDLWNVRKFIHFNQVYKGILSKLNELNDVKIETSLSAKIKMAYFRLLVDLIYDITKDNFFFRRIAYKRYLRNALLDDSSRIVEILTHILQHNSVVKKKLQSLQDFDIWQTVTCQTDGAVPFTPRFRTGSNGEQLLIPRYLLN